MGWLYTKIFENSLFFFDYWSFIHLWSGLVIFMLLAAFKFKRKWLWLFSSLFLYELLEIAFLFFALNIFKPETFKDQVTDIIIGLIGGWISYQLISIKSGKTFLAMISQKFQIILSSFTFAFIWVGSYQYQYNISYFNTPGLNLWAFFLWLLGGYYIIELYLFIKKRVENKTNQLIFLWLTYIISLLILEFIGYYCLHIAEISFSYDNSLIFGLIHGSFWLHVYYLISPFLIIAFYEILTWISASAQVQAKQTAKLPYKIL